MRFYYSHDSMTVSFDPPDLVLWFGKTPTDNIAARISPPL
jgi:hypothetical protein